VDLGEDSRDVAASFLDDLLEVMDEVSAMANASCDDLRLAQQENPNVFRSVRGFAATLKSVAVQRPDVVADQQVKTALTSLDTAMGELDGALALCGINTDAAS
jgi:sulfate adenylyltransferase subunit 1 (EFTu-like GTPase family)